MEVIRIGPFKFFLHKVKNITVLFSTAWNNADFSQSGKKGTANLESLKELLQLDEIGYMKQVHGDEVCTFEGDIKEGDAIITNKLNKGIGVFTADCVPVILADTGTSTVAAVHSGWKGTYKEITAAAIDKMTASYGSDPEDIKVFIGPHIRNCCYEVGEELIDKFKKKSLYFNRKIAENRNLNMEECIMQQCTSKNIPEKNIFSLKLCTACAKEPEFYSYRKNNKCGRLFSMVFIKE